MDTTQLTKRKDIWRKITVWSRCLKPLIKIDCRNNFGGIFWGKVGNSIKIWNFNYKTMHKEFRSCLDQVSAWVVIEFFHLKPVNEFSEFNEFLICTCRKMTTCTHVMNNPCELSTWGKVFFILVVKTTHVKLDSLAMESERTTRVIFFLHICSKLDSIESTENRSANGGKSGMVLRGSFTFYQE